MADLLVRGVDDALVQALKKRAGAHSRSQEAELLAAMPDVGVDADFQRQHEPVAAADVFD
jgi:plasmid stability protein